MPDGQQSDCHETSVGVSRVALQVLGRLKPTFESVRPMMETYLSQMYDAACAPDRAALGEVVRAMRKARVSPVQIAEEYVPAIARRLGDAWVDDRIGFLQVSLGSVRLQAVLRDLGRDWGLSTQEIDSDRPSYLVGVPAGFQHTLGVTVLAGQLRHRGFSVHLRLDLTPDILRQELERCIFRGVLLSAYGIQELESLRQLALVGSEFGRRTPVIIGGNSLELAETLSQRTAADFATCDVGEALAFCDRRHAEVRSRHSEHKAR
ncbi:hypothetical protein BOO69_19200 (plasmid) [Sulfitobacter alexandrii]|uniref:B12-binding domain-containing protein n=1 Tax=Sulfitobacter alexandrii TaxID=1917485 RepID=A0A1J0WN39_9RHOB|nr:cobalamin B12-binding domain-containing protein [Sulfitobacter alexandrii]APE45685.1 hypothetical protein BOO69_19200 [Sulfitobacter alexandrii]